MTSRSEATSPSRPWSGWLYTDPDAGPALSANHPIRSGECPAATDVRPATREALRDELTSAWRVTADLRASSALEQGAPAGSEVGPAVDQAPSPHDVLQVRQIMADVDRVTLGRRRIDIAHALLTIVGQEIAANAGDFRQLKGRAYQVAKDLKAYAREKWAEMERRRAPG